MTSTPRVGSHTEFLSWDEDVSADGENEPQPSLEWKDMLPTKKTSKCRTRTRRSHQRIRAVNYALCSKCGQSKLPHAACTNCGYVNPAITLKLGKEEED